MIEVNAATLEEAESFICIVLLFVPMYHAWIDRNFVDVAENLNNEPMEEETSKRIIINKSL
jgi:hypothetical protein